MKGRLIFLGVVVFIVCFFVRDCMGTFRRDRPAKGPYPYSEHAASNYVHIEDRPGYYEMSPALTMAGQRIWKVQPFEVSMERIDRVKIGLDSAGFEVYGFDSEGIDFGVVDGVIEWDSLVRAIRRIEKKK